jgi:hypothetical protein
MRPHDDSRGAFCSGGLDDTGRRISIPDEDLRLDAGGADPIHQGRRVGLTSRPDLVEALGKEPAGKAEATQIDAVDDQERDPCLNGKADRDPFRRGRDRSELGAEDDRTR